MLDATAVMVGRGSVREVFRVEYEGRTLVVKRMSSSWEDAPQDQQRRIRRIARREVVALDAVSKRCIYNCLLFQWGVTVSSINDLLGEPRKKPKGLSRNNLTGIFARGLCRFAFRRL